MSDNRTPVFNVFGNIVGYFIPVGAEGCWPLLLLVGIPLALLGIVMLPFAIAYIGFVTIRDMRNGEFAKWDSGRKYATYFLFGFIAFLLIAGGLKSQQDRIGSKIGAQQEIQQQIAQYGLPKFVVLFSDKDQSFDHICGGSVCRMVTYEFTNRSYRNLTIHPISGERCLQNGGVVTPGSILTLRCIDQIMQNKEPIQMENCMLITIGDELVDVNICMESREMKVTNR